ncbi:MAG: hypothetical protein IKP36_05330 [Bacteroidaceae bacterium]|nr:hypothetical protein [Bacteroidaceae bacterium]
MTRYELLTANYSLIKLMAENGITPRDIENIQLFSEFNEMKSKKHKTYYIVAYLCEKYNMSERGVYNIINRMKKKVKL